MANVKGSALIARFQYVEEKHGEAGTRALLAALPPEDRERHRAPLLPSSWYPFAMFLRVNTAIDRIFGKGDLGLLREVARYAADRNLPTFYRFFFRFGSVGFILSMGGRLWRLNYDPGELKIEAGAGEAVGTLSDWPEPDRVHCISLLAWFERSCELSGGKDVRGDELTCRTRGDDACRYRLRWS